MDRKAIKDTYKNSHVIKNFSDNFVVFFFLRDRVDVINFSVISSLLPVRSAVKLVLKKPTCKISLDLLLLNFNTQMEINGLLLIDINWRLLSKCVISKGNWTAICMNRSQVLKAFRAKFIPTRFIDTGVFSKPGYSRYGTSPISLSINFDWSNFAGCKFNLRESTWKI